MAFNSREAELHGPELSREWLCLEPQGHIYHCPHRPGGCQLVLTAGAVCRRGVPRVVTRVLYTGYTQGQYLMGQGQYLMSQG